MRRSRAISRPSSASPLHSVVTFLLVIVFSVLLQASASSICAPRPIAEPLPQGSSRLRCFCSLIRAHRPQISSCINWPIIVSFIRTASSTSTSKIHPRTIPGPSLRFVNPPPNSTPTIRQSPLFPCTPPSKWPSSALLLLPGPLFAPRLPEPLHLELSQLGWA